MDADANRFAAGLHVLAVDEDHVNQVALKRALEVCNYNNVTAVAEASTALDMLRERKDGEDQFDLVIGDFFLPNGINGLKFLELITMEMDIPVIVLSANDKMETMVKALQHGACDYLVKPVHPKMLESIWHHVVRKNKSNPRNKVSSGNDNPSQMVQFVDNEDGEKDDAKLTMKHWKKNRKDGDGAEKDADISTQKKQRVEWSSELHFKFVEAINHIGMDKAVPKKILEVMNVDGISRQNIASHLQKYRMYLKKLKEGTLKYSAFAEEQQAWLNGKTHADSNMSVPECSSTNISNEHSPLGTSTSFPSSLSSISYASKLRASILGSNKGIPFDPNSFSKEREGGGSNGTSTGMPINNFAPGGTVGRQTVGDQENNNNQLPVATREVQIDNYVIPAQMLNGGVPSCNVPEGSSNDLHPVGDQVNSTNELPTGISEAQSGAIDNIAFGFLADWVKQDLLNNDDAFFSGNVDTAP